MAPELWRKPCRRHSRGEPPVRSEYRCGTIGTRSNPTRAALRRIPYHSFQ